MSQTINRLTEELFSSFKGYVSKSLTPLIERLNAVENRHPIKGDPGRDGVDGKDADEGRIIKAVLAELPIPKDGKDGAPGIEGKPGRDGIDGKDGLDGKPGADGKDGVDGKNGLDGKDGRDGKDGERGEPGENGAEGRPGKDGLDGKDGLNGKDGRDGIDGKDGLNGKDGERGADGMHGKDGADGRDGRDGEPGRDAFAIDVLPGIDIERSYQRGTWAKHAGGLWCARGATRGMHGWDCIVTGVSEIEIVHGEDLRTIGVVVKMSDGEQVTKQMKFPVTIHRDVWREDAAYEKGDQTTRDGSQWTLMTDVQNGKPGEEGSGWKLSSKRGRDGRDGLRGERGEKGLDGRPGRDLQAIYPDGSKQR